MASRAVGLARLANKFSPSSIIRCNFLRYRAVVAGYHTAKSNPPLPMPFDDNRNVPTKWDDDGLDLGDYPNLPYISYQRRPQSDWWDFQDRRNYAEPIHEDEDALNIWIWQEVECNDRYTKTEALTHLLIAFGLLGVVWYLSYLYDAPSRNPAIPREMPFNNLYLERGGDPDKDPSLDKGKVLNTLLGA